MEFEPCRVPRRARLGPIEMRAGESRGVARVGNLLSPARIRVLRETGELGAAPLGDRARELRLEVAEELEWGSRRELLSHEQQRRRRREQQNRREAANGIGLRQHRDALAAGAVTNLVVVLQKADEGRRGKRGARLAAAATFAKRRSLSLV